MPVVKAALRAVHSPDVEDLASYAPGDEFGFLLEMMIGPREEEGEEAFELVVCTPGWLARTLENHPVSGAGYLFVGRYDFAAIEAYLRTHVEMVEGATWKDVATKLSRFARWEFEDYES
jgi:hypothetical protein